MSAIGQSRHELVHCLCPFSEVKQIRCRKINLAKLRFGKTNPIKLSKYSKVSCSPFIDEKGSPRAVRPRKHRRVKRDEQLAPRLRP